MQIPSVGIVGLFDFVVTCSAFKNCRNAFAWLRATVYATSDKKPETEISVEDCCAPPAKRLVQHSIVRYIHHRQQILNQLQT